MHIINWETVTKLRKYGGWGITKTPLNNDIGMLSLKGEVSPKPIIAKDLLGAQSNFQEKVYIEGPLTKNQHLLIAYTAWFDLFSLSHKGFLLGKAKALLYLQGFGRGWKGLR